MTSNSSKEENKKEELEKQRELLQLRESKVSDFWRNKYTKECAKNWDLFYKRNTTNFFKDRHWINREFEELPEALKEGPKVGLELGCGVGNFIYPVLKENPNLFIYACDFSKRAIEFVKQHEEYDEKRCHPFVCDLTKDELVETIPPNQVDFASMIFVLSAIPPEKMNFTIENIAKVMKLGGIVFLRDYASLDAAEIRFKPENKIEDRFYVRQDGTFSYYFELEEVEQLFLKNGFEKVEIELVEKDLTNVKRNINEIRRFIQAKFRKI